MTNPSRNTLPGLIAITAAMMMPVAFAAPTQSVPTPPPAATTIVPVPTPTNPAPITAPVAIPSNDLSKPSTDLSAGSHNSRKSWVELDTNKDGNISKSEAAGDVALNSLFAKADANADGTLTPDEYRTYLASNQASARQK